jgi:hypothetical protein
MDRVECEKGGYKGAAVNSGSHNLKEPKKQQDVCRVQKEAGQVVTCRVETEDLYVRHV